MTSEERHHQRYLRRMARRAAAKKARLADTDDFNKVFTYAHMYEAYRRCRCNVGWMASAQRYVAAAPLNIQRTQESMKALHTQLFISERGTDYEHHLHQGPGQ